MSQFLIALVLFLAVSNVPAIVEAIVNGYSAPTGTFRYVVLLSIKYSPYAKIPDSSCTGTFIGKNWVLTAAHCVSSNNPSYPLPSEVKVFMGSNIRNSGIVGLAHNCSFYAPFNHADVKNDIALVYVVFNPSIDAFYFPAPLTLPPLNIVNGLNYENITVQAAGWGHLARNITYETSYLQWNRFAVVSNDYCMDKINRELTSDQFCLQASEASLCRGDSGGPAESSGYLIGLLSFSVNGSCSSSYPTVYTRLNSKYLYWIGKMTGIYNIWQSNGK